MKCLFIIALLLGLASPCYALADHILISEVYYDTVGTDADEEFIELYNPTSTDADIGGWTLSDNSAKYSLPAGTVVGASGYLVIARSSSGFNALFGFNPDVSGLTLSLNNGGDQVSFADSQGTGIDFVAYENFAAGWDISASTGKSIQRTALGVDTDSVSDWTAGAPTPVAGAAETPAPETTPPPTTQPPTASGDRVKIASFNIQVFGQTKAGKPDVMNILSNIVRNFDLVAIQEIRDVSETTMPQFKETINAMDGPDYDFIIGPRLGRTTSKEQYVYLYNTQTIEVTGSGLTYPEPPDNDVFEREPFIAPFKVRDGSFDFVLINIHTKPDYAAQEINYLPNVVEYAKQSFQGEGDFIVLGDFNADCSYFDDDGPSPLRGAEYIWIIENSADTTTKATDCTYDRIVATEGATTDYAGDSGVFGFDTVYGLTYEQTVEVSDHYPVYAEFWTDKDTDGGIAPTTTPPPTTAATPTTTPPPTTAAPTPNDNTTETAVATAVIIVGGGAALYKRKRGKKK